jgi:hypothetical protein
MITGAEVSRDTASAALGVKTMSFGAGDQSAIFPRLLSETFLREV